MAMDRTKRERIDWRDVPRVYVTAPSCAACGCLDYDTNKSSANGDGSTTRKALCRACGSPFKIVTELPNFGISRSPLP